jgi:hypothetical protein
MTLATLPALTLRKGGSGVEGIENLVELLQQHKFHTCDFVQPLSSLYFTGGGNLAVGGLDPVLDEVNGSGFVEVNGIYRTLRRANTQLSGLLDFPARYMDKLRTEATDENDFKQLLDHNLNSLAREAGQDGKKVLIRAMYGTEESHPGMSGVVRAVLSDKYRAVDYLDTTMSALAGMSEAGLGPENIRNVELSDNRLYIFVDAPGVEVVSRVLMKGYRSPFTGQTGEDMPMVRAGFVVTNSEVGNGAFAVYPYATFLACMNGYQISTSERVRKVHLGGRLEEGQIDWSNETRVKANELLRSQVKDAVVRFLSEEFLEEAVRELEKDAGVELAKPEETIKIVSKEMTYSKAEQEGILSMFIRGGQITSGGVAQAVTAFSQTIADPDRAFDFNGTAQKAMQLAARYGSK